MKGGQGRWEGRAGRGRAGGRGGGRGGEGRGVNPSEAR